MAYPAMGVLFSLPHRLNKAPGIITMPGALRLWKDKENRRVKA